MRSWKRDARFPADETLFEKDKLEFAQKFLIEKKTEAFNGFMSHLRAQAHLEDNISKLKNKPQ